MSNAPMSHDHCDYSLAISFIDDDHVSMTLCGGGGNPAIDDEEIKKAYDAWCLFHLDYKPIKVDVVRLSKDGPEVIKNVDWVLNDEQREPRIVG